MWFNNQIALSDNTWISYELKTLEEKLQKIKIQEVSFYSNTESRLIVLEKDSACNNDMALIVWRNHLYLLLGDHQYSLSYEPITGFLSYTGGQLADVFKAIQDNLHHFAVSKIEDS